MSHMTWIRLELPDALHRRLKAQAALRGQTIRDRLTEIIEKGVEEGEEQDKK